MKFFLLTAIMLFLSLVSYSQYVVEGSVKDAETGDGLPGANVFLDEKALVVDAGGEFSFRSVKAGVYNLKVSFIGYETFDQKLEITKDKNINISMKPDVFMTDEVIVSSTRASQNTPTTFTTIGKEEIEENNLGQDLPFLLNWTPSLVTTSDAGAGVGYTGLRIRGSDATRINVTINGIPLNDSESQGVFWVDIPDIASSTESIQIQRGVGTSTNGAGAFGGTISLQTNKKEQDPYGEVINSFGSYNTWRHTLGFGTGLINDRWTFDGRLSKITSDGYIDRATSDLNSYYLSGGFYGKNTLVKAIMFGGKERTYQSWYGTPEAVLENDKEGIEAVIANNGLNEEQAENIRSAGRTFNWYLYEDEVDDYQQDHYQLHLSQRFAESLTGNISLHYTKGKGYYEQFRDNDEFSAYGLDNIIYKTAQLFSDSQDANGIYFNSEFGQELVNKGVELLFDPVTDANGVPVTNANGDVLLNAVAQTSEGDFIRRRWLDNDFYGLTYSFEYQRNKVNAVLGGAYNEYKGGHFGEIIWAEYAVDAFNEQRYYENNSVKKDFNAFIKINYQLTGKFNLFGDLQYRNIDYTMAGVDSDLRTFDIDNNYDFFNPKFGATYQLNRNSNIYASYSIANREPVRGDFIDSPEAPEHETMRNLEAGFRRKTPNYLLAANYYLMDYSNQLVLTGKLNDSGSALRTNVGDSYRMGIEFQGQVMISDKVRWSANATLSRNKIETFDEVIYDYGTNWDEYNVIELNYEDTDISFSPNVIAGSQLAYLPAKGVKLTLLSKYVGKQYLDNTSNENRAIDAYFVNDLRFSYTTHTELFKEIGFTFQVNNVFDELYASNGYTFGYRAGDDYVVRENYYYPQATRNFLASFILKF
ncbi:MAG: TonB-dependent receptor [Fulvivirga sp.]